MRDWDQLFSAKDFAGIIYTEARAKCLEEGFSEEPGSLAGRVYQNMADVANRILSEELKKCRRVYRVSELIGWWGYDEKAMLSGQETHTAVLVDEKEIDPISDPNKEDK
jgi:hypothetical protein